MTRALALILLLPGLVPAQEPELALTRREAVRLALLNNSHLLELDQAREIADRRLAQARAERLPRVEVHSNYSRYKSLDTPLVLAPELSNVYLPAIKHDLDPEQRDENYFTFRASARYLAYSGGRVSRVNTLAEAQARSAHAQYDRARQETVERVNRAFSRFLAAREVARVRRGMVDEMKTLSDEAARRAGDGYEAARFRVEAMLLSNGDDQAVEAEAQARLDLLYTIGLELTAAVTVPPGPDPAVETPVDLDQEKALAWAFHYRPELSETGAQEQADALSIELAASERWPTLLLGLDYQFQGRGFPLPDKGWDATVNLSFPIFDGWARWSRQHADRARERRSRFRQAGTKDRIRYEVQEAYQGYQAARRASSAARAAAGEARKVWGMARDEYRKGRARASEIVEAARLVSQMEEGLVEKMLRLAEAQATLELSIGANVPAP